MKENLLLLKYLLELEKHITNIYYKQYITNLETHGSYYKKCLFSCFSLLINTTIHTIKPLK